MMEATPKGKDKECEKWEIENWCRTLTEAEEIKADPKKMALVKPHMEKMMVGMKKTIASVADLRAKGKAMAEVESEADDEDEYA